MRTYKVMMAVIGIALLFQACGNLGAAQTNPPSTTESIPAAATDPSGTELTTNPTASVGEFFSSIPFRSGLGFRAPWLELYFVDPTSPFAEREVGSVDAIVAASIVAAQQNVDIALRTLRVESLTDALIAVSQRGIPVRVVAETDSLIDNPYFQALRDAGIVIIDDQQAGLMNNTFVVVDQKEVWTGSVDFDLAGIYRKNNALIRIQSPELAADYVKEFEEMFINHQFGPLVAPETPYPSVTIQGTRVDVFFSPDDVVLAQLSQLLSEAKQSIYFLSYSFASDDLGSVIREKAAEGLTVGGVLESDLVNPSLVDPDSNQLKELELFREAGLDIRLDSASELMNHKITIIDEKIVVIGSYDFTNRAENENDENVLVIYDEKVAQKFMEEFERIQSRARQ
ncbi:MAG TPA: phospholipase D-like domain-containing protein [Anaerolineales bacterium]|nr:phospholipase D-like domain-containing protein [Anaerolineales bacterium]